MPYGRAICRLCRRMRTHSAARQACSSPDKKEIHPHGSQEEGLWAHQAPDPGRPGQPRSADRPRPGCSRRQHHGVLQGVQRGDRVAARQTSSPVEITVYEDRSFTFITKTPPAAELIKKAAGVPKGSATPHTVKVASLTQAQVREIAESKMPTSTPTTSRPPPRSSPAPPVPWASPSRPEALAGLPALSTQSPYETVEGPRAARTPRLQGEADDQALQGLPRRG